MTIPTLVSSIIETTTFSSNGGKPSIIACNIC